MGRTQANPEEALAGQRELLSATGLRVLAESNVIGIAVGVDDRVLDANPRFLEITGHGREELARGLAWPDASAHLAPPGAATGSEPGAAYSCRYVTEYPRGDGSRVPTLVLGVVLPGPTRHWVVLALDLAEIAPAAVPRVASPREAPAREEGTHRASREALAQLAHQLRTPLNAALLWVRLIRSGVLDAAATEGALETIEKNLCAQGELIRDLVDAGVALRQGS